MAGIPMPERIGRRLRGSTFTWKPTLKASHVQFRPTCQENAAVVLSGLLSLRRTFTGGNRSNFPELGFQRMWCTSSSLASQKSTAFFTRLGTHSFSFSPPHSPSSEGEISLRSMRGDSDYPLPWIMMSTDDVEMCAVQQG